MILYYIYLRGNKPDYDAIITTLAQSEEEAVDNAKKATFHRIATEEMGHYKALHDIIFASAETPFEKAFKDESEKCYMHMMKKVQEK